MSNEPTQDTSSSVQQKIVPAVGNTGKMAKYLAVICMAILAAILGRGFLVSPDYGSKEQDKKTAVLIPASATDAALNLDMSNGQYAASLPILPVKKIPPPPSVLPSRNMDDLQRNVQADETRLKSPTLIYGGDDKKTSDISRLPAGSSDPNSAFLQQASNTAVVTVTAKRTTNMDYKILQGKLIAAVLETSINSDLPGMVRAVVSKDVYGDTGKTVLLAKGTRLIGQYNSSLAVGQTRVMAAWTRAITPEHVDIALGSPNADNLGRSGVGGDVDTHFWQIFGTSALLSVLGVVASNNTNSNTTTNGTTAGNPYQTAVAQGVLNSSSSVLQSRINIQPTIHVPQGSAIQVFVARDLDFSTLAYYQKQ